MKYVKKIESNMRQGCSHELSPCTVVTGPNRSGKSTVIDAVTLALMGEARSPGIGKAPAELSKLTPPGEQHLEALAVMDDDTPIEYKLDGGKKSWRRQDGGPLPVATMPLDAALGVLYGQPKRVRQAVLDAAGDALELHRLSHAVGAGGMAKALQALKEAGVEVAVDDEGTPDMRTPLTTRQLAAAAEAARKRRLGAAKDVTRCEKAKAAEQDAEFTEADAAELADLEERIEYLARMPMEQKSAASELELAKREYDQLLERAQGHVYFGKKAQERAERTASGLEAIVDLLEMVIVDMSDAEGSPEVACFMCGSPGHSAKDLIARKEVIEKAATQERKAADHIKAVRKERKADERKLTKALQSVKALETMATQGFVTMVDEQKRYQELSQKKAAAAALAAALTELPEAQREQAEWESVQGAFGKILEEAVEGASGTIDRRMNAFLPKTVRARLSSDGQRLEVSRNKGEWLDFRAMSGADRAELSIAFAVATLDQSEDRPVKLLVLDETMFDTATAKALMKCLAQNVHSENGLSQVIMSLVSLTGALPAGWTSVELGKKKKRKQKKALSPEEVKAGPTEKKKKKAEEKREEPKTGGALAALNTIGGV